MRFQIKKLLEGFDPADLIEQSMYCFGSDSDGDGSAGEENAIAGELDRSDVVDVSNVSNSENYDAIKTLREDIEEMESELDELYNS